MIGDNSHRLSRFLVLVVFFTRFFFEIIYNGHKEVGFITVRNAVQKGEKSV